MNLGIALVPHVVASVNDVAKICGPEGIRKAVPLVWDDMVGRLTTAEALASVASSQELILNSWKEVEGDVDGKRGRLDSLRNQWKAMLKIIKDLKDQADPMTVRYVVAHQMQSSAEVTPDGTVILEVGANVSVEFTYDEAAQRLTEILTAIDETADRLTTFYEECKKNVVISEVNISQLHNFGVEFRDKLAQGTT